VYRRNEPRPAGHGSIGQSVRESLVGIVSPGSAANLQPEYLHPPVHEVLDRARVVLQVATAGDRTPVEAWLSLTNKDREAIRETKAWHEAELAGLRRQHPAVADAMPPVSERGMRWRVTCSDFPSDERDAALRIDEHERALAQFSHAERSTALVIRHRHELLRAYRIAVARRPGLRLTRAPTRRTRSRPRSRARRLTRSPRRTRGPNDDEGDGDQAPAPVPHPDLDFREVG
jgi:hypothetical protein